MTGNESTIAAASTLDAGLDRPEVAAESVQPTALSGAMSAQPWPRPIAGNAPRASSHKSDSARVISPAAKHGVAADDYRQTPSIQPRTGLAWLACATAALVVLATAAAIVSWDAQYVMVAHARRDPMIAALEAGIPDAGAAVFAALGVALALHGHRAIRPRALNLCCVGLSVAMNAMAATPGWREIAIWVMPAAVYALASDTLIGVVRAWVIARTRSARLAAGVPSSPGEDSTPLAIVGASLLWLLRLAIAPASTLAGFRRWVIAECPAAPGSATPYSHPPAPQRAADEEVPTAAPTQQARRPAGKGTPCKQDVLISRAGQRRDLRTMPLGQVAALATAIGGEIGLHPGTARRVLRAHVRTLQDRTKAAPEQATAITS